MAIGRLRFATTLASNDPVANCSLGRALVLTEQPAEARHWLETCVRLRPESAEDHYRLSRVYQELNLKVAAAEQISLATKLSNLQNEDESLTQKITRELSDERESSNSRKRDEQSGRKLLPKRSGKRIP
jgi:predicted Zn-dependent protease